MRVVFLRDHFKNSEGKSIAVPVGLLSTNAITGHICFRYDDLYLNIGAKCVPIDPVNLPLARKTFDLGKHGCGAIRDTAPDSWGRLIIDTIHQNITGKDKQFNEIDYITFHNPARIGNIDFSLNQTLQPVSKSAIPQFLSVFYKVEKNIILNEEENKFLIKNFYAASIGGARPKITIIDENGILWVAKFPSVNDRWPEARIEKACLDLARVCGIETAEAHIETFAGKEILFSKRFDRDNGERIGYLSAHSVLRLGHDQEEEHLKDYRLLADQIVKFGFRNDLNQLFRRIAYNIIIRNTDAHPRNHAFLLQDGKIRLSPAYDILPVPWCSDMDSPAYCAMDIGIKGREATKSNLLSASKSFGLSKEEAESIFDQIAYTVATSWQKIFMQNNITSEDLGSALNIFKFWENKA